MDIKVVYAQREEFDQIQKQTNGTFRLLYDNVQTWIHHVTPGTKRSNVSM